MVNIPGILAKSKKSSDLHGSLKIYKHLKSGMARKFKKRDSLWEPKTLCGKHFWKIKMSLRKAKYLK